MASSLQALRSLGLVAEGASVPSMLLSRPRARLPWDIEEPVQAQTATSSAPARDAVPARPPRKFSAATKLPGASERCFSVLSWNVLLPNNKDGWWIFKYYRHQGAFTEWSERQKRMDEQLRASDPDVACLQECSGVSALEDDFAFLLRRGYEAVILQKKGRMLPATFWKRDVFELVSTLHKDRTLVTALRLRADPSKIVFIVNGHLAAGPQADRRLRQAHEALEAVAKEAKKLGLASDALPTIFCGDFNSQGVTGVTELLQVGEVGPDFRESGDPTERGRQGLPITTKRKAQSVGAFRSVGQTVFGEAVPATMLATNIDSKMLHDNGSLTPALTSAIDDMFRACCTKGNNVMDREEVDAFLMKINFATDRGFEMRFLVDSMEKSGNNHISRDEFVDMFKGVLAEGKFWEMEHDMTLLLGRGMAIPEEGPCELCFDHMFFTPGLLRLIGAQEPLTEEQKRKIWSAPFNVLPCSWYPSDHVSVAASFSFKL